jgi:hypothetical protein
VDAEKFLGPSLAKIEVTNKDCLSNKKIWQIFKKRERQFFLKKTNLKIVSPTKIIVGNLDHSQQSNLWEASA